MFPTISFSEIFGDDFGPIGKCYLVTSRSNVSRNAAGEATLVDGHLVMDFFPKMEGHSILAMRMFRV